MWGSSAPRRCRSPTRRRRRLWCRASRGPGRGRTGRGRSSRRACLAGARWPGPPPPAAARCRDSLEPAGMPGSGSWEIWEVNTQHRQWNVIVWIHVTQTYLKTEQTLASVWTMLFVFLTIQWTKIPNIVSWSVPAQLSKKWPTLTPPLQIPAPVSWHRNVIFPWSIHQIIIPSSWVIQFKCTQA